MELLGTPGFKRRLPAILVIFAMSLSLVAFLGAQPAEAASTVLYSQNFNSTANGSTPTGWNNDNNNWAVENGIYMRNSTAYNGWTTSLYEGDTFSNFNYTVEVSGLPGCSTNQSPPVLGIVFRATGRTNNYLFWADIDKIQIIEYVSGYPTVLASKNIGQILPASNSWFNMTVEAVGTNITAVWNNNPVDTLTVFNSYFSSGYIGVATYNCNAEFNNVIVTSLGQPVPSFELTALLNVYNSRPDLQAAFPGTSAGAYANLVNWAYGVVAQHWVDASYDALAPYAYWYTLLYTYNTSPDLQSAFPNVYYSTESYQSLINWAGGVVTQHLADGRYSTLAPFAYWYALMMTYNQRSDLQGAFPNVYSNSMTTDYQSLINWAGGVVTQQWVDGSYSSLQPFGYWYTLMYTYNTGSDLQAAFPNVYASQSQFQSLVNWAGGVATQQWVDGRYSTLNTYGCWYDLMAVYNVSPDLQSAFPGAYTSLPSYQSLINWAGGVVTHQWTDGRITLLNTYGYWYDLMMVYNRRPDLQAAFPNANTSPTQYQNLINWARNVVTGVIKPRDGSYTNLNYYAPYYESHYT